MTNQYLATDKKYATPYAQLCDCTDVTAIDGLMDEIGLVQDKEKRLLFLYGVMGVEQAFGSRELTPDERLDIAKDELISQDWKEYR